MTLLLPQVQAEAALAVLRRFDAAATQIGVAMAPATPGADSHPLGLPRTPVSLRNGLGVRRPLDPGRGEHLPRIC